MSVSRLVSVILVLTCGAALFLASERIWFAQKQVTQDRQLAALAQAKSDWLEGTIALSFERSVTQVALALDDRIPPAFKDLIDEQRAQSDVLLNDAIRQLSLKASFENGPLFTANVSSVRDAIEDLRLEADMLLSLPKAERDALRVRDLPYALKSRIEELFSASHLMVVPNGATTTREMGLSRIQGFAWEIREYSGRARTFYAIATLTGAPIPTDKVGEAAIDSARAAAAWDQLNKVVTAVDLPPAFVDEIRAVEAPLVSVYFSSLDALDQAMATMRAGETASLPYSFEEFFGLSNAGLDAVAALAPSAGAFIQLYWADRIAQSQRELITSAAIAFLVLVIAVVSARTVQRRIVIPLGAATAALSEIAGGNLERAFRASRTSLREVDVIWRGVEELQRELRSARDQQVSEKEAENRAKTGVIGELMNAFSKMAQGDLTIHIEDRYGETYSALIRNINKACVTLREAVSEVVGGAIQISSFSDKLTASVKDLSGRTDRQSEMVAETAASLRNLSDVLQETAENTKRSNDIVVDAAGKATAGGEVVQTAIDSMGRIRTSSDQITRFTDVIDDIAFQTSLLAINAGVEAARAGEAGKGFAVVAFEVGNLASRAAESASEIKELVAQSSEAIQTGEDEVSNTGRSLQEITTMVQEVEAQIRHIDGASRVQAGSLTQIGQTMNDIDAMTKQNAAMAEEATTTSDQLRAMSAQLQAAVGQFKTGARVRATHRTAGLISKVA